MSAGEPQGWTVGAIRLACGTIEVRADRDVAGWVKGPFGLDFRMLGDGGGNYECPGYVLTHLPTGFIVRHLHCGLAEAQVIADELLAGADWTFTTAEGARDPAVLAIVKAVSDADSDVITNGRGGSIGAPA